MTEAVKMMKTEWLLCSRLPVSALHVLALAKKGTHHVYSSASTVWDASALRAQNLR
jgi:hypothetical protein